MNRYWPFKAGTYRDCFSGVGYRFQNSNTVRLNVSIIAFLFPLVGFSQQQIASVAAWKVSYDSAQHYWADNIQRSVGLLQKAERVAFNDLGIYDENYLVILNDLGLAYSQIRDYKKAQEYLTRSLAIQHELYTEENGQTLRSACNLAAIVLKGGDDLRARQLYKIILLKSNALEAGDIYMTASEHLANLYEVQEHYDSALATIRQALHAIFFNPLPETAYKLGLSEGRILRKLKRYEESEKALTVLSKSVHATSLNVSSLIYSIQMEQSLIKLEMGLYAQAEKELLELYRTVKNSDASNEVLLTELPNSIAYAYDKLGIYDKALLYYQESFSRCLKTYGYNSLSCAIMQNNMAGILLKQGHVAHAISQYEEFIETYKNLSKQNTLIYYAALNNLATAYRQSGRHDKAFQYYNTVYEGLRNLHQEENDLAATVRNNIGVTQMLQGRYEEAIQHFNEVIRIKEHLYGKDSPALLDVVENLAVTYWASGQPDAALPLFNRSLTMTARELRYIFPNLTEQEQVQFYTRQKLNFERFNTLVLQQGAEMPELKTRMFNNQLLLKSITFFTNKKRSERVRGNAHLKDLLSRSEAARVKLGHFYQLPSEEVKALTISIPALEQQIDSLEKVIRHALADESVHDKLVTWSEVQRSLRSDEALVDIIRFRKYDVFRSSSQLVAQQVNTGFTDSVYYAALITTAETTQSPVLVFLKNGKLLETRNHKYYINTLKFDVDDTISYAEYWLPIERAVESKKKIYIVPDGVYHQVNLNVIRNRHNRFVIERFDLHTLMNSSQLVNRQQPVKIDFTKTVLMGDPVFGSTLSNEVTGTYYEPLPGSKEEIKGILHALKLSPASTTLYMRQAATESNLKKVHGPSILHIATHGFFSTDVIRLNEQVKNDFMFHSGLILSSAETTDKDFDSDGILSAYEVMNLDLNGTDLVVLSACETGLGKVKNSEGVYGLQRSFLQAGADNIIISLWKVEDMMTKDLMIRFYSYLGQQHNAHDALKLAQLDLIRTVGNPRLWGGFVMVSGN